MEEYILKLKDLNTNFSYQDFLSLLSEIDIKFTNGHLPEINEEFLHYFNNLMNFVNDKVVVEGKHITLGNMLIESKLLNKEKLTPTLVMYLYCDKKKSIGLEEYANKIKFAYDDEMAMGITAPYDSTIPEYLQMNINWYGKQNMSVDEHNYRIIHDIIHEIMHVYQGTRKEDSENIFDRITYYDEQIDSTIIREFLHGSNAGIFIHEQMLMENTAEETAQVYMIQTYGHRIDLFNQELLDRKRDVYKRRKAEFTYQFPRYAQDNLLGWIIDTYKNSGQNMEKVQTILDKINVIKQKQKPMLEELKEQGISENFNDNYYNVYLGSYYQFDGQNIVMQNDLEQLVSKGK